MRCSLTSTGTGPTGPHHTPALFQQHQLPWLAWGAPTLPPTSHCGARLPQKPAPWAAASQAACAGDTQHLMCHCLSCVRRSGLTSCLTRAHRGRIFSTRDRTCYNGGHHLSGWASGRAQQASRAGIGGQGHRFPRQCHMAWGELPGLPSDHI